MNIKEKISALLANARDPGVTQAEAAAFAARAARMLEENNLSEHDLPLGDQKPIEPLLFSPKYADPWRRSIVFAAAELYMCRAFNTTVRELNKKKTKYVKRKAFYFVGRESSTQTAEIMCEYFFDSVVRLSREYSSERAAQLGFQRGCGEELAYLISSLASSRREDAEILSETDTAPETQALALRGTDLALVNDWVEENMEVYKASLRGSSINDHGAEGSQQASRIGLSEQVGAAPQPKSRRLT